MRIHEIPPYFIIPSVPKKEKPPEEPISFCGHIHRLMMIQRRHMMLERMMCWWDRMTSCLRMGFHGLHHPHGPHHPHHPHGLNMMG